MLYMILLEKNFSQKYLIIIKTCSTSGGGGPRPPFSEGFSLLPSHQGLFPLDPAGRLPSPRPHNYLPGFSVPPGSSGLEETLPWTEWLSSCAQHYTSVWNPNATRVFLLVIKPLINGYKRTDWCRIGERTGTY